MAWPGRPRKGVAGVARSRLHFQQVRGGRGRRDRGEEQPTLLLAGPCWRGWHRQALRDRGGELLALPGAADAARRGSHG